MIKQVLAEIFTNSINIYRVAGVGSLDLRQAPDFSVKNVHLFHQAGQSSLRGLSNLLKNTFRLKEMAFII